MRVIGPPFLLLAGFAVALFRDGISHMTWRLSCVLLLAFTIGATACTSSEPPRAQLGPVTQLNAEPGTLALFTFPYYTSLLSLENGGAVAAWMRQQGEFRLIVTRR